MLWDEINLAIKVVGFSYIPALHSKQVEGNLLMCMESILVLFREVFLFMDNCAWCMEVN